MKTGMIYVVILNIQQIICLDFHYITLDGGCTVLLYLPPKNSIGVIHLATNLTCEDQPVWKSETHGYVSKHIYNYWIRSSSPCAWGWTDRQNIEPYDNPWEGKWITGRLVICPATIVEIESFGRTPMLSFSPFDWNLVTDFDYDTGIRVNKEHVGDRGFTLYLTINQTVTMETAYVVIRGEGFRCLPADPVTDTCPVQTASVESSVAAHIMTEQIMIETGSQRAGLYNQCQVIHGTSYSCIFTCDCRSRCLGQIEVLFPKAAILDGDDLNIYEIYVAV